MTLERFRFALDQSLDFRVVFGMRLLGELPAGFSIRCTVTINDKKAFDTGPCLKNTDDQGQKLDSLPGKFHDRTTPAKRETEASVRKGIQNCEGIPEILESILLRTLLSLLYFSFILFSP